jgi:hypothetical protein
LSPVASLCFMCLPSHFGKVSLSQHLQYTAFEPGSNFSCKHTHPVAHQTIALQAICTKLSLIHTLTHTPTHSVSALAPSLIVSSIHLHICNALLPYLMLLHPVVSVLALSMTLSPFVLIIQTFISFLQRGKSQPVWPLWENRAQFFCSRVRLTCAGLSQLRVNLQWQVPGWR